MADTVGFLSLATPSCGGAATQSATSECAVDGPAGHLIPFAERVEGA